ncbi:hypothetical protein FH972_024951 [Carpinus fangiana]|uniref:Uncharacterized protein n=1 Tax=Carpinus fangiana TaxID=176857 RepID=A0A5N6KZY2_9ROSI|nr:hypothetical protein FH972_024951 [Carpinus fangiana]
MSSSAGHAAPYATAENPTGNSDGSRGGLARHWPEGRVKCVIKHCNKNRSSRLHAEIALRPQEFVRLLGRSRRHLHERVFKNHFRHKPMAVVFTC